jgi:hypothetical protein
MLSPSSGAEVTRQGNKSGLYRSHIIGVVCICRSMTTFRRIMLSPYSGAELTRQGSTVLT